MATLTPQQEAVLKSRFKHNLVNASSRSGKTTLLLHRYRSIQEHPVEFKAIFITANALATQRILNQLFKVTNERYNDQLVGTMHEISYKLLQKHYASLGYTQPPRFVQDGIVAKERADAKKATLKHKPAGKNQLGHENVDATDLVQWNKDFVERLRKKNVCCPRSLLLELATMFRGMVDSPLTNISVLVADDVHDYTLDELTTLAAIKEKVLQCFFGGNTNLATTDAVHETDQENWQIITSHECWKHFYLPTSFGLSPTQGLFTHQLASYNVRRIAENLVCLGDKNGSLFEMETSTHQAELSAILALEVELQLGIRGKTMGVIMRSVDDTRQLAKELDRPYFIMWDKSRLWNRFSPPEKGIICTTPYEAPYLNLDYVVFANCIQDYWPFPFERSIENCRKLFLRGVTSAKSDVYFLTPSVDNGMLPSPFLSEGNNPKFVTKPTPTLTKN